MGIAEIITETGILRSGDEILITGPTTGVVEMVVNEMRMDDKETGIIAKGDIFSIRVVRPVRRSDKLYKYVHSAEANQGLTVE